MANHIDPFKPFTPPNVNGLYDVHFPKFAFWAQKIQPLVYDDSLSYYEVLCRISQKLNEVIKQINDLTEAQKEFIEKVTALLNQLISEWNQMVDYWNSMVDTWETWENEFNSWEEQFNQWRQEFVQWRQEINNAITNINNALKQLEEFENNITNEWNSFKQEIENTINQIRQEINNIKNDITNLRNEINNIDIDLNSVPIIKQFSVSLQVENNLGGTGEYAGGTIACADLIYPECTIRFISAIISAYASFNVTPSTGALETMVFDRVSSDGEDLSFNWLGQALTNPAIGAGQISIDNVGYPCTMQIDNIITSQDKFIVKIPSTSGVSVASHNGRYNVYEGGKTLLYKTTAGYFGN